MSDVKQTIQVTNAGLSPILSIAQGTGMVEFEFTVSDFLIPAGSAAVAWNIQPTGNVVSKTCAISGNIITVQPPAYYFLRGKNYMQIQVTGADGVNLFTFLIEVWCSPNISAPVVSQNPDLISQLIQLVGNTEDLETVSKTNLVSAINEIYNRGVVDILDTEEEIEANTDTGKATGALVAKQLISDMGGCQITTEGSGESTKYFIQRGADSASKKELGVEPSTLRLRLYGRAYSYIPTYEKNIKVTRWEDNASGLSGLSFYGTDIIGGEVGDALPHIDPSSDNDDYTIECEAFKYIAIEAPNRPTGSYNVQIDYI